MNKKDNNIEKTKDVVKKDKSNTAEKCISATFSKRLAAFIIDILLISFISSIVTLPIPISDNYSKLSKEATSIFTDYEQGKIDIKTYFVRSADISYDMSREIGLSTIITVGMFILYFIVFQFYYGGRTIGKRLLGIKIVDMDGNIPNINMIAIRSLIVNFILIDLITLVFTIFGSKNIYFFGTCFFQFIQYCVIFVSSIMILSRKDKRGLHDLITNTQVINI